MILTKQEIDVGACCEILQISVQTHYKIAFEQSPKIKTDATKPHSEDVGPIDWEDRIRYCEAMLSKLLL